MYKELYTWRARIAAGSGNSRLRLRTRWRSAALASGALVSAVGYTVALYSARLTVFHLFSLHS